MDPCPKVPVQWLCGKSLQISYLIHDHKEDKVMLVRADSVNLVQSFGTVCCLYTMKHVFRMQHFWYLVWVNYFLKSRGDVVHEKTSNVLRSYGYNNSLLLQHKKLKIQKRYGIQTEPN